jgi:hypothetical protein
MLMDQLGWSIDESVVQNHDGSTTWQVSATRHGHVILVWGVTRTGAWKAACRQIGRLNRTSSAA